MKLHVNEEIIISFGTGEASSGTYRSEATEKCKRPANSLAR